MEFTCLSGALQELGKCAKTNFSETLKLLESIQLAYSDFYVQLLRARQDHGSAHLTCGYERPEQLLCAFADQTVASLAGPVDCLRNRVEVLRTFGNTFALGIDKYIRSAAEANSELRNAVRSLRAQVVKATSTMSLQDHRQIARQTKETKRILHNAADILRRMLELVQLASTKAHTEISTIIADFPELKFQQLEAVPNARIDLFRTKMHDELNIVAVFETLAVPAIPAILPMAFDSAAPSGHQIVDPLALESKCACPISAKINEPLPLAIGGVQLEAGSLPPLKPGTTVTVVEGGYKKVWEVEKNGFRYPCRSLDLIFS
jgi:hypothetical protein